MKFNKIITVIIVLAVILISLDFITLTDRWRFLGWEIFFEWEIRDSALFDALPEQVHAR